MDAKSWSDETRRAFRRLSRCDFQAEQAVEAERQQLAAASPPVESPLAQDYVAWRRSLLWIAGIALTLLSIYQGASFEGMEVTIQAQAEKAIQAAREQGGWNVEEQIAQGRQQIEQMIQALGRDNLETIDGVFVLMVVPVLVGGILALLAAWRWKEVQTSRRLARIGWLILFLTPFALALLPVKGMLEFGHLQQATEAQRDQIAAMLGLDVGMRFFLVIGPRAISIFPGVIRSSMALKTLIPQSPMPGWAAALVAPLYAIFLLVVFALVVQSYGNALLVVGLGCLMVSPLIYLWKSRLVLRAHRPDEVGPVVGRIRRLAAVFNLIGGIFLAIFMIDVAAFGLDDFVKFFVTILGNVVLLTVVGADFMLALLKSGHEQSKALVEGDLAKDLEARFEQLSAVGLADLGTKAAASSPRS